MVWKTDGSWFDSRGFKKFFSPPILSDRLSGQLSLRLNKYCWLFPREYNCRSVKLANYPHFVLRLRTEASLNSITSYAFIALLTYLLTPWSCVLLEKLTGFHLVKKFPTFYGTRRFITVLTSSRHLSLSWGSSIQSRPPHPTSCRSILNNNNNNNDNNNNPIH